MPCYDERMSASAIGAGWQKRADLLARVACSAFQMLTDDQIRSLPNESQDWWHAHQISDKGRFARGETD